MTGDVPFAEIEREHSPRGDDSAPTESRALAPESTDTAQDDAPLPTVAPQRGHFGFTLRELIIVGAWVLAFVLSFVPGAGSMLDLGSTVWTMNGAWVLTIGVPTAAVFLLVLRRLSPEGIRRVGSLGIDQFASVAFSVAAVSWAVLLWQQIELVAATRQPFLVTWSAWVELVLMLLLVAVTVFAALIPGVMETIAHRNADPVRPVFSTPRPVKARGSVSDPLNEDDVDPGLRHDDEVGASGHLTAGIAVAPELRGAGYVPEQHRESFVGTDEESVTEASTEPSAPLGTPIAEEAPTTALPVVGEAASAQPGSDDVTEALPDLVVESAAPVETAPADRNVPASGRPDDDAEDEEAPAHSDTMTHVLGELLDPPAAEEDVATHAVDVAPSPEDDPAPSRSEKPSPARTGAEPPQPFWALAPDVRPIHDARGDEIFRIGPDAWILVLEDRGGAFVVRHDDGRVGYLHDTENMTRG